MSFVLCSYIDCLPSLASLKRMQKRSSTSCSHCCNHQILHHILNHCSVFLSQGPHTWRYNSVLNHLVLALGSAYSNSNNPPQNFADLRNCLSPSGSTMPSDILCTTQSPDLVLIFPDKNLISTTIRVTTNRSFKLFCNGLCPSLLHRLPTLPSFS